MSALGRVLGSVYHSLHSSPQDGELDLEARRVILIVDDLGKDHGGDEIGQCDNY